MKVAALAMAAASLLTVEQRDARRSNLDYPTAAVSADGAFIAFTTYSRLATADVDQASDLYVLDRLQRRVMLESADVYGRAGNVADPDISGDGRYIVFERGEHVFLRDRTDRVTHFLATGRQPDISEDGQFVVFAADTFERAPGGDANGDLSDIYAVDLRDLSARRVSVNLGKLEPAATISVSPSISGDGRYIAFTSKKKTARGPAADSYVFLHDAQTNVTKMVGAGWDAALSGDGRAVAFVATSDGLSQICLADLQTGATRIITRSVRRGLANGSSAKPRMSSNGRFVVFQSEASDLVAAEDINLLWDVFVFDRESNAMSRVSGDADAVWMEPSSGPSIDGRGSVVAFSSRHPTDASDKQNDFDLYVATLALSSPQRRGAAENFIPFSLFAFR
jgi:Tol biopolymer transport system component